MIELKDLLQDGEVLVQYHLCNEYWSRNAITVKGNDDIGSALEMTLHRILEAGGTFIIMTQMHRRLLDGTYSIMEVSQKK